MTDYNNINLIEIINRADNYKTALNNLSALPNCSAATDYACTLSMQGEKWQQRDFQTVIKNYLQEHSYDSLDIINNKLTDATHILFICHPTITDELSTMLQMYTDNDNMLFLSDDNYDDYINNRLTLTSAQSDYINCQRQIMIDRYNLDDDEFIDLSDWRDIIKDKEIKTTTSHTIKYTTVSLF